MKFFEALVIVLSFFTIVSSFSMVFITSNLGSLSASTAKASESHIFLCINTPPNITNVNCPSSFNQSTLINDNHVSCNFSFFDEDNNSFEVESQDFYEDGLWFSLDSNGHVSINASQDGVGNHTVIINVSDASGCPNRESVYHYSFFVLDINDPPEYVATIPPTQLSQGTSVSPYSLNDYFSDPDGDHLNYSVVGANAVSVSISQSTGSVVYTAEKCATDYLIFTATDPGNLSADSGVVTVKVACTSSSSSTSGGGSGGGSGSSYSCTPRWQCRDWSECSINGTQFKICFDLNGCSEHYTKHFYRNCTYIPTCFDGVQNGDEEGVDCGGHCKPCGTCFDGIQNNDEEGVDCGGTYCEPCHNCSDGIMNWGETGLDCGGPFCEPCPSCSDGVQNCHFILLDNGSWDQECETGVDCGGPCSPCTIKESPSAFSEKNSLLGSIALVLFSFSIAFLVFYKLFFDKFKQLFARIGWYFTRKKRKEILLSQQHKRLLLSSLKKWESHYPKRSKDLLSLLDDLTSIARDYYSKAFNLLFEFSADDLNQALTKLSHDSLKVVLSSFFSDLHLFESASGKVSHLRQRVFAQELRAIIFSTSVTDKSDLGYNVEELKLSGSMLDRFFITAYNLFLAVQFESLDSAKKHYYSLIKIYSKLSESDKSLVYPLLQRSYNIIKYLLSWSSLS